MSNNSDPYKLAPTKCKNCKETISFSFTSKNYCNERCLSEYRKKSGYYKRKYRENRPKILLKVCLVCTAKFTPATNGTKYCCKKCLMLSPRVRKNPKILIGVPLSIYRKVKILGLL